MKSFKNMQEMLEEIEELNKKSNTYLNEMRKVEGICNKETRPLYNQIEMLENKHNKKIENIGNKYGELEKKIKNIESSILRKYKAFNKGDKFVVNPGIVVKVGSVSLGQDSDNKNKYDFFYELHDASGSTRFFSERSIKNYLRNGRWKKPSGNKLEIEDSITIDNISSINIPERMNKNYYYYLCSTKDEEEDDYFIIRLQDPLSKCKLPRSDNRRIHKWVLSVGNWGYFCQINKKSNDEYRGDFIGICELVKVFNRKNINSALLDILL